MIYYFTIFQDKHIEKQQQLRPGDFCWYKGDEMNYIRGIFSLQDKLYTPQKKTERLEPQKLLGFLKRNIIFL